MFVPPFRTVKGSDTKVRLFQTLTSTNYILKSDYGIERNRFLMPDMNSMGILIIY